jgi:hypothetical protein
VPTAAQLDALGEDGRALVTRLCDVFDFNHVEAEIVVNAAVATDRIADLRGARAATAFPARLALDRAELAWMKHLAALLLALRVQK